MFTIRFLIDRYGWDKCIEVFGWNEWMLTEGRASDTDTQTVTEEDLIKLEGGKQQCQCSHYH